MKEKQFNEALERMSILQLDKYCINNFKEGDISESEGYGALYDINMKESKMIKEFEKENNALVYHLIHNIYEFGECYSILYVSQYVEEWEQEKEDLKEGYAFVYVKNMDDDFCSEFGTIAIKPQVGGLVRIS